MGGVTFIHTSDWEFKSDLRRWGGKTRYCQMLWIGTPSAASIQGMGMNSSSGSGAAEPSVRIEGQQRELIIISLATYGDFVHDLLRDERRLNVAITRAKYKLIILGDAAVLKSHPAYYSLFRHCVVVTAADIRKDTRPSCRGPIKEQKP